MTAATNWTKSQKLYFIHGPPKHSWAVAAFWPCCPILDSNP